MSRTLTSSGGRLVSLPHFLLASCADGDQMLFPSFVKNRERVLKVMSRVDTKCQKVRR